MAQSRFLAVVLSLSGLLSGCGSAGNNGLFGWGRTITVLAELSSRADPIEHARVKALLEEEVREFKRINPQLNIRLRALPSDRIEQDLSYSTNG